VAKLRPLDFHPLAVADAQAAYDWGLDEWGEFAAELFWERYEAALDEILEAPEAFPFQVDNQRRRKLRGLPYRVIYKVGHDGIFIVAVAHDRQESGYWAGRL